MLGVKGIITNKAGDRPVHDLSAGPGATAQSFLFLAEEAASSYGSVIGTILRFGSELPVHGSAAAPTKLADTFLVASKHAKNPLLGRHIPTTASPYHTAFHLDILHIPFFYPKRISLLSSWSILYTTNFINIFPRLFNKLCRGRRERESERAIWKGRSLVFFWGREGSYGWANLAHNAY
jgi:hypothetical protein